MKLKDGTEVEIGWDGVPLGTSPYLAFDTETDTKPLRDAKGAYVRDAKGKVQPTIDLAKEVPPLACLQVSNGRRHVLVRPEQVADFIVAHKHATWVGHNVAFDWHVIYETIDDLGSEDCWESALDENRVRDTMLLDFLARLADASQTVTHLRGLGEAAKGWLGLTDIDKESDYRLRFGEVIGADWDGVDPGFWEYAIGDVITTHRLYAKMIWSAVEQNAGKTSGKLVSAHGPLTECLQTRAAVVLAGVGHTGFSLDASQVDEARKRLKTLIDEKAAEVESLAPGVFRRYKVATSRAKAGDLMVNKSTGTPTMNYVVLRESLSRVAVEMGIDPGELPTTAKTNLMTTALDPWREAAGDSPLVRAWCELTDAAKLHQFLCQLSGKAEVNASYVPLVRTGRTSCRKPNVQQMPKVEWLRGLFVARPGHKLVIVDYSAIELVTLAAVCLDRFGESVLAEQIKAGRDPHAYTAALVQGVDYDGFVRSLKQEKEAAKHAKEQGLAVPPTPYAQSRQSAKAVNFGVPGGLGAVKLAAYAKANYGVTLAPDEAAALRQKLTTVVYPELALYLADDAATRLGGNIGKTKEEVVAAFGRHLGKSPEWWFYTHCEKIVFGQKTRVDGQLINDRTRQATWDGLADLTRGTNLYRLCRDHEGDPKTWRRLFGAQAVTLTGRVRAGLSYTEARNTPFQGLASDGAKVALYRLWEAGHRIVAFVHDEIVCEVPEGRAEGCRADIERTMIEAMSSVLACDIPVKVEGVVSERWVKG